MADDIARIAKEVVQQCDQRVKEFREAVELAATQVTENHSQQVIAHRGNDSVATIQFWIESTNQNVALEIQAVLSSEADDVTITVYQKTGDQFTHWTYRDIAQGLHHFSGILNQSLTSQG